MVDEEDGCALAVVYVSSIVVVGYNDAEEARGVLFGDLTRCSKMSSSSSKLMHNTVFSQLVPPHKLSHGMEFLHMGLTIGPGPDARWMAEIRELDELWRYRQRHDLRECSGSLQAFGGYILIEIVRYYMIVYAVYFECYSLWIHLASALACG